MIDNFDVKQMLWSAMDKPMIIEHANPRSFRMRFYNTINLERNKIMNFAYKEYITILAKGKGEKGRLIIGPKDFDVHLPWRLDLNTCSQSDLDMAFDVTYPKNKLANKQELDKASMEERQVLRHSIEAGKANKEEEEFDPYKAWSKGELLK